MEGTWFPTRFPCDETPPPPLCVLPSAIGYSNVERLLIFTFAQAMDVGVVPARTDFSGEVHDGDGTHFLVADAVAWADAEHLRLTLDPQVGGVISGVVTYTVTDPNTWQTVEGVPVCGFENVPFTAID